MLPTPRFQQPLTRIGIRLKDKGYSCVIVKDKHKTTCIYTAHAATHPNTSTRYAAIQN